MHRLPLPFALLSCCGYWRPTKWQNRSVKYWLYNIYSLFMVLFLYYFTLCACIDCMISKDLKTMTGKSSLVISVFGVCLKVTNLFLQRGKIIDVMNILLTENCIPKNEREKMIQQKNDNYARKLTIYCEILNELAVFFATWAQYYKFIRTKTLPVSDFVPYDLSSKTLFIVSLVQQTIGLMICANTSVANETLIAGLMIQAGAQFELLCHRAKNLSTSLTEAKISSESSKDFKIKCKRILGNLIQNHIQVYKFAHRVNSVFECIIFLQFSISSTVLCLSICKMSTLDPFSVEFIWSISYLCCMLMQVYLYCWFGNESNNVCDAVYEMDWTILPPDITKELLLIMARCKQPVRMNSGHVVTLSVESFMTITKITYSSYNLLTSGTSK